MGVTSESYKLLVENSHFKSREEMDLSIKNHRKMNELSHMECDVLSQIARSCSLLPVGAKEMRFQVIADKLGISLSTVNRAIKELTKLNIIKVVKRYGKKRGQVCPIISVLPYVKMADENADTNADDTQFDTQFDIQFDIQLNDFDSLVNTLPPQDLDEFEPVPECDYPTYTTITTNTSLSSINISNIKINQKENKEYKKQRALKAKEQRTKEFRNQRTVTVGKDHPTVILPSPISLTKKQPVANGVRDFSNKVLNLVPKQVDQDKQVNTFVTSQEANAIEFGIYTSLSREEAQIITKETFFKLVNDCHMEFKGANQVAYKAYLHTTVKNYLANWVNKKVASEDYYERAMTDSYVPSDDLANRVS
ncbi:winged helix-turn-helix transcriptional regulator [Listeria monocytogenes]|nr:winged helix-turn-helix transcriptional regulator [Listeria monocytogenes]